MNGHFITCDICGARGHKAKNCGLNQLEAVKDPFGEFSRKNSYRLKRELRRNSLPGTSLGNIQTSPGFGL